MFIRNNYNFLRLNSWPGFSFHPTGTLLEHTLTVVYRYVHVSKGKYGRYIDIWCNVPSKRTTRYGILLYLSKHVNLTLSSLPIPPKPSAAFTSSLQALETEKVTMNSIKTFFNRKKEKSIQLQHNRLGIFCLLYVVDFASNYHWIF